MVVLLTETLYVHSDFFCISSGSVSYVQDIYGPKKKSTYFLLWPFGLGLPVPLAWLIMDSLLKVLEGLAPVTWQQTPACIPDGEQNGTAQFSVSVVFSQPFIETPWCYLHCQRWVPRGQYWQVEYMVLFSLTFFKPSLFSVPLSIPTLPWSVCDLEKSNGDCHHDRVVPFWGRPCSPEEGYWGNHVESIP